MVRLTHLAVLDEPKALLDATHGHQDEQDRDVGDGVGEDTRGVANLDAAGVGIGTINVVCRCQEL